MIENSFKKESRSLPKYSHVRLLEFVISNHLPDWKSSCNCAA